MSCVSNSHQPTYHLTLVIKMNFSSLCSSSAFFILNSRSPYSNIISAVLLHPVTGLQYMGTDAFWWNAYTVVVKNYPALRRETNELWWQARPSFRGRGPRRPYIYSRMWSGVRKHYVSEMH